MTPGHGARQFAPATRNLPIVSTILVLGIDGATIQFANSSFSILPMALAAVAGVFLDAVLPREKAPATTL